MRMNLKKPENSRRFKKKVVLLIVLCILFVINLVVLFVQSEYEKKRYEQYASYIISTAPLEPYIHGVLGDAP